MDDFELLKNTQITTNGKEFIVGFAATKDSVQQMISRMLGEQKIQAQAQPKPTETPGGVPNPPASPAIK